MLNTAYKTGLVYTSAASTVLKRCVRRRVAVFTNASSGSKVSYFSTKRHTACVRPARRVPATAAYSKWRCYGFVQSALWFQVTLGAMGEEVVPARGLAVRSFTESRVHPE